MSDLLKVGLFAFLAIWCIFGLWLIFRYGKLFGPHPDDPAESPGARSFGVTHIWIVWFGVFALTGYFLLK